MVARGYSLYSSSTCPYAKIVYYVELSSTYQNN
jgi:hypothetical protein